MSGITIKPFYVKFYVTRFNRCILKFGKMCPYVLRKWFEIGAVITCILIIPAIFFLLVSAFQMSNVGESTEVSSVLLQPVVLGFNLPFSQVLYYLLTLFLCSVLHELGHAIAAVRENVQVEGCGVFVIGVIPAAFIDLQSEHLISSSSLQQLRIFCAGIWHNIALSSLGAFLLLLNPVLLSPFFIQHNGISVVNVEETSGISGPSGLLNGDIIKSVCGCTVDNSEDWKICLKEIAINAQVGYCSSKHFILKEMEDLSCSGAWDAQYCTNTSSHLCFSYLETAAMVRSIACLPVRKVLGTDVICKENSDCPVDHTDSGGLCIFPHLESTTDRLMNIERKKKKSVLYIGQATEIFSSASQICSIFLSCPCCS